MWHSFAGKRRAEESRGSGNQKHHEKIIALRELIAQRPVTLDIAPGNPLTHP